MAETTHISIDAAGKTIGRVASSAAKALMGKTSPNYTPHIQSNVTVTITGASKLHISDKKKKQKHYQTYSGYPSGQRIESLSMLITRRGHGAALKKAIERMIPRNRLRVARMKNLTITD